MITVHNKLRSEEDDTMLCLIFYFAYAHVYSKQSTKTKKYFSFHDEA